MIQGWKEKLLGSAKKLSGRTDVLEAMCAANAYVASVDGTISDTEVTALTKSIKSSPIAASFSDRDVAKVADTMIERANGGRVGRNSLMKEIREVASDWESGEIVLLGAIDVAEASEDDGTPGSISDKEKNALKLIATELSLDLDKYL